MTSRNWLDSRVTQTMPGSPQGAEPIQTLCLPKTPYVLICMLLGGSAIAARSGHEVESGS